MLLRYSHSKCIKIFFLGTAHLYILRDIKRGNLKTHFLFTTYSGIQFNLGLYLLISTCQGINIHGFVQWIFVNITLVLFCNNKTINNASMWYIYKHIVAYSGQLWFATFYYYCYIVVIFMYSAFTCCNRWSALFCSIP